jgi:hypothetical protein
MSNLLLLPLLLGATIFEQTFSDANMAYEAGDFAAAVAGYEQLVESDVSDPTVFYNLGNAHLKQGQLGAAIANYERALQVDPDFRDAHDNLQHALGATKRKLARPQPGGWRDAVLFWDRGLQYGTVWWLATVMWLAFWVLVAAWLWRRPRHVRAGAAACLLVAVLAGLSAWAKAHPAPLAVTADTVVPVRFGVSETEPVRFELFDGDRVRVERRVDDWVRVATATGERGWAKADRFVLVGPPYEGMAGEEEEAAP